ncbi:MAG: cobalt-precorrin-5B (C(1))-methyltransferase CbiD [Desulfomonilaceae bacterium]|nr:cobalt-precorrin-5B (C(1))-methyltransferase CbiD [Desulfomonilaceae bacterium]
MSSQRTGFTTGTCAAAAAKAASMILIGRKVPERVEVGLPDGTRVELPIVRAGGDGTRGEAAVKKDAGDDPDVTDGALIVASVTWARTEGVTFFAGEGVGTVTKPGLALPPGEPAVNPVPRNMISAAVREVTDGNVSVTVSIPGGRELAEKTFNPRLGVTGGLSILGTSGIVRPFSGTALRDSLRCALSVAVACGVRYPILVPGRIGERAAGNLFQFSPEQLIEVSNEWGFMLDQATGEDFDGLLVVGHPGKTAKLPAGHWDTHSTRSPSAVPYVAELACRILGRSVPHATTVEGLFHGLPSQERERVADELAAEIRNAISFRIKKRFPVTVVLVTLSGSLLGSSGDVSPWK